VRTGLVHGLIAGAAGTLALNAATYLDMSVRARSASTVPTRSAARLAERAGIDLGEDVAAERRAEGLGALLGYAVGLGFGAAYGALSAGTRGLPTWSAGMLLAAATMTAELPATRLSASTGPGAWGVNGWLTGIVPHVAYGMTAAAVYARIERPG